ncbi:MAG: dihydropteroate synthase [Opitutales bacterium]|nr:dihydropteroate synthase [Opitutales bacterium]
MGSNTGDRIANLSRALNKLLEQGYIQGPIRCSRLYRSDALLLDDSPKEWNLDYINGVVEARTWHSPDSLLRGLQQVEQAMGRGAHAKWSPRSIDIDILYMDDTVLETQALTIPHREALKRSFVLYPLRDLLPQKCPLGQKKTFTELADELVDTLNTRPIAPVFLPVQVVGILNITPDSFSDGARYNDPRQALEQLKLLVEAGAAMIDIGAESTRPGAESLGDTEEWARLAPVLNTVIPWLNKEAPWIRVSVDTRHASVAKRCLEAGTHVINDVSGLDNAEMRKLAQESQAPFIFMHHLGIPVDKKRHIPEHEDPIHVLKLWAEQKARQFQELNIDTGQAILDPGIGFGKTPEQSLEIVRRFTELKELGMPLYLGFSRKSFFSLITDNEFSARDVETHAMTAAMLQGNPDFLRVHDVEGCIRTIKTGLLMHSAPSASHGQAREQKSGS